MILPRAYDIIGNIAIIDIPKELTKKQIIIAKELMHQHPNIKTVLKKAGRFKGRLRTRKLQHVSGIKTKETIYTENNCRMKLNVETCYFSPRLANERQEITKEIKKNDLVLIMFSGVGPFGLVISRLSKAREIVMIELNREATKYAEENIRINKLSNIRAVQGDVKRIIPKFKEKFDKIVMARPQLKETFLKEAFKASKKGTIIYFYDFLQENEIPNASIKKIQEAAKKSKKKIKILAWKKCGEIAPYKFRVRIDFIIL
jgi:tRNA (guanine37-N1)-methyltransferase